MGFGLAGFLKLIQFRAKVIRQNLIFAYPDDPSLRAELYERAYGHLGQLFCELLLLFGPLKEFAIEQSELLGFENWKAAHDQGKGVIFLSSHVGNWEIMAATGGTRGISLMMVTKKLKPQWIHDAVEVGRKRASVRATYEPKTFRDVLSELKNKGTVGIVLDQYAGAPVGVRVPFFGKPVGTHTVLATLAKRTGAIVLPALCYRKPDGRSVVEIQTPLSWITDPDPHREIAVNTAYYTSVLERHIREHADQWLWTHRRFKGDLSPLKPDEWSHARNRS